METHHDAEKAISLASLRVWQREDDQPNNATYDPPPPTYAIPSGSPQPPFAHDAHLNARVVLWNGPIWRLQADAIVNPTNEALRDTSGLSRKILEAAGKEIWTECDSAGQCRTGEAVVTRGCRLPARKLIHTVGPRYNPQYHNAAEHALHMCYRASLSAAVEHKLASVAFPCLYAKKKSYPRDEAAHIAARTVRRFLEHYREDFSLVVFCVDSLDDELVYEAVLPLYFPRNKSDEQRSATMLATRELGDAFGEPVIEERRIRIGDFIAKNPNGADDEPDELSDDEDAAVQSFCEMSADPDVERLERLKQLQDARHRQLLQSQQIKQEALTYQTALAKAQQQDFGDLGKMRFLYNAGVDHSGDPVIVYMASRLRVSDKIDLDRVMLFIIGTMDAVVDKSYSLLYVHTAATSGDETQLSAAWLKRLFKTFSAKYQTNLRFFYMYEPTMWLKLLVLVAKGFVSSAFYKKIVYLASPEDINHVASSLDVPHYMAPTRQEAPVAPTREEPQNNNNDGTNGTGPSCPTLFPRKPEVIV